MLLIALGEPVTSDGQGKQGGQVRVMLAADELLGGGDLGQRRSVTATDVKHPVKACTIGRHIGHPLDVTDCD